MATGQREDLWRGLVTSIADELYEMAGGLLVRTTALYTAGDGSVTVEGTDRWPSSGRLSLGGLTATYSGKTNTSFTGLVDDDGNPGVALDFRVGTVVADVSRSTTQMDDLRASFLVATAEDNELDILARNYGIARPPGVDDATFRLLLQSWIYLEAQTIYGLEQILDILFGAGNYTLYEDLEEFPHRVFVDIPLLGGSTQSTGKTYLVSGEPQTRTAPTTVDVDNPVATVYGVYDAADPFREGTNYAMAALVGATAAAFPTDLFSPGLFLTSDVGKGVIVETFETWTVLQYITANRVTLGWPEHFDATFDGAQPDRITTDHTWFAPWMVGHSIVVSAGLNAGTYTILEVVRSNQVRVSGLVAVPEANVGWTLTPVFPTDLSVPFDIVRATAASNTITTPVAMPVNVLVDYTHVPSAQALSSPNFDGELYFPFYLFDATAVAQFILDLITAAGVEPVLETV